MVSKSKSKELIREMRELERVEYGLKELITGLLIGLIIGLIIGIFI